MIATLTLHMPGVDPVAYRQWQAHRDSTALCEAIGATPHGAHSVTGDGLGAVLHVPCLLRLPDAPPEAADAMDGAPPVPSRDGPSDGAEALS